MTILAMRPVASRDVTEPNILDRAAVAELLGFTTRTVDEYRARYRDTDHPFPEPDGFFGRSPYWLASRADDLRRWAATRPGRGNPLGRTTI